MTWLILTAVICGSFSAGFAAGCWWASAMSWGRQRPPWPEKDSTRDR